MLILAFNGDVCRTYSPNKIVVTEIYVKTRHYLTAGGLNWLNTGPVPAVANTVITMWVSQDTEESAFS